MGDTRAALGDPDDAGSAEPYDTGKDEKVFSDLDEGKLGEVGKVEPGKDDERKGEEEPASVDEMLADERGKEGEEEERVEEEEEEVELDEDGKPKVKEKEEEEPPEPTEDDTLHNRPSYSAVKKAYPDLFKKFPELRSVLFREPEFSKIFPTVKEARETAAFADEARQFEISLSQGDPELLFKSLHEASPAAMAKFVENIPGVLYEVSQESYVKMTTPIIRNAVILARQHARGMKDKDLWNGLDHIEKFLFGDPQFSLKKETPREDPLKEERENLNRERQKLQQTTYRAFEGRVKTRSEGLLKKEFGKGLDPQNSLTPRMRDMLVEQAIDEIAGRMQKDNAHLTAMNNLWKRASQAGLSAESEEQLIRAYLSRARPLIGSVRRKMLAEVLGRGETKSAGKTNPPRVPAGKERGPVRTPLSGVDPRKVDYNKTSDEDILSGRVTLRK